MNFLKNDLITLIILVIAIWVKPTTSPTPTADLIADSADTLEGYCKDIFQELGFKDGDNEYEQTKKLTFMGRASITNLKKIYGNILSTLNITDDKKFDDEDQISIVSRAFAGYLKKYLKEKKPVTNFCIYAMSNGKRDDLKKIFE